MCGVGGLAGPVEGVQGVMRHPVEVADGLREDSALRELPSEAADLRREPVGGVASGEPGQRGVVRPQVFLRVGPVLGRPGIAEDAEVCGWVHLGAFREALDTTVEEGPAFGDGVLAVLRVEPS